MTPERYKSATYADVPQNIKALFEKMKETRRGLYIHGGVGTGKTHVSYALLNSMDSLKLKSWFKNIPELLREIRLDLGRANQDKTFVEEKLMDFGGLLFLDDIGSERMTEWVEETFYLIINKRYEKMLPIIFTSNLSIKDLSVKVGDRIASRIVEMCDIVELTGNDRRLSSHE